MDARKLISLLLITISSQVFSQALKEKNAIVEFNYGFPVIEPLYYDLKGSGKQIVITIKNEQNNSILNKPGQFAIRSDYMISNRLSIGGFIGYSRQVLYHEESGYEFNPQTGMTENREYFYKSNLNKWRFSLGLNFHYFRNEKIDFYCGFQSGYKKTYNSYSTNDPSALSPPKILAFPFAFRFQYGMRMFITEVLALNCEIGIGGPIASAGITYRFF